MKTTGPIAAVAASIGLVLACSTTHDVTPLIGTWTNDDCVSCTLVVTATNASYEAGTRDSALEHLEITWDVYDRYVLRVPLEPTSVKDILCGGCVLSDDRNHLTCDTAQLETSGALRASVSTACTSAKPYLCSGGCCAYPYCCDGVNQCVLQPSECPNRHPIAYRCRFTRASASADAGSDASSSSTCSACASPAITGTGTCAATYSLCADDGACVSYQRCLRGCGSISGSCAARCAAGLPGTTVDHAELLEKCLCNTCATACSPECGSGMAAPNLF